MAIIETSVSTVKKLLETPLIIPNYQRPYKWQEKHVNQLLSDLLHHRNKSCYRLGTIVLCQEEQSLSVVDGQQRLLTLTLVSKILDDNRVCKPKLLEQSFNSLVTVANLQHNAAIITGFKKQLNDYDRSELIDFMHNRCELICVKLDNLSEAFQFFDSQNARGKPLEPYDLLKAFHLREMNDDTEKERIRCVSLWESTVNPDIKSKLPSLHSIMGDYLFRLRRWSTGRSGTWFTRHNIDVFKGVNLHTTPYRYTESLRALDYMVNQYNTDNVRNWDLQQMGFPFQISQVVINGRRFFDYIQHYIMLYKILFIDEKIELKELLDTLNNYEGRNRTGDHYVRILFECAVLYYYDKFGDAELEKVSQLCFVWSYRIRLTQKRVAIESIDNAALSNNGIFTYISRALHPQDVLSFNIPPLQGAVEGTKVKGLINQFITLGYL